MIDVFTEGFRGEFLLSLPLLIEMQGYETVKKSTNETKNASIICSFSSSLCLLTSAQTKGIPVDSGSGPLSATNLMLQVYCLETDFKKSLIKSANR